MVIQENIKKGERDRLFLVAKEVRIREGDRLFPVTEKRPRKTQDVYGLLDIVPAWQAERISAFQDRTVRDKCKDKCRLEVKIGLLRTILIFVKGESLEERHNREQSTNQHPPETRCPL